ncbi:MAG: hypothetical protein PHU40_01055 [Sulfurimonas sp.]|nr:hypothetical protein [Sulfurimonas sp.]
MKKTLSWLMALTIVALMSACSSSSSSTDRTTMILSNDFAMILDVNESSVSADWKVNSGTSGSTASVVTDGLYGLFSINGDIITYTKTTETQLVDFAIVSIDGTKDINVSLKALYWKQSSGGIYHTAAIKSDGTLWSWGDNVYGQLGDGTTVNKSVPTQEDTNATDWSSLSAGSYHTTALKSDGTLWAWGDNTYAQLGDNTTVNKSVPTQEFTAATDWSSVAAGGYHTTALKSDGTLWAWGANLSGQLGDGTTVNKSVPTQESTAATNWSSVAGGIHHSIALKSDGTLWSWGDNGLGQLGDGTTVNKSVPTQESTAATNWSSVSAGNSHSAALKSDGTLWAWGKNGYGELGDNTTTDRSVPTQESTAVTDWSSVTATGGYHTAAIKSDGTLWAWGWNVNGQLGDGTTVNKSVPTQENTAATNWNSIAAGGYHTTALKRDGTLWAWGGNNSGQLGDGTTVNKSIPEASIVRQ